MKFHTNLVYTSRILLAAMKPPLSNTKAMAKSTCVIYGNSEGHSGR